jgi:hypothetical protein
MSESSDSPAPDARSRMETDEVLGQWARTASQADRNAVHKALFAMLDGSLFETYRIVENVRTQNELYVIVRDDLVLRLRINDTNSFHVIGIGPPDQFSSV